MSKLQVVDAAIAKKEDQLQRAKVLDIAHLEILASDAGRFAQDDFRIFYHELQLRKALEENPDIDVEYARIKMEEFADHLISILMTRELVKSHVAAIATPIGKARLCKQYMEQDIARYHQSQHKAAIQRLCAR